MTDLDARLRETSRRPGGAEPTPASRPGRLGLFSVLVVAGAVVAATVSVAVIQRETGGSTPSGSGVPAVVAHEGEIRGMLLISPPMAADHSSSGSIVITGAKVYRITVGDSGRFAASVPPGHYTVIGHSPEFGNNRYDCVTQAGPVTLRRNHTVTVRVRCLEK
jgi:hypothetical protein